MDVPDGIIYISLLNYELLNLPETPKEFKEKHNKIKFVLRFDHEVVYNVLCLTWNKSCIS